MNAIPLHWSEPLENLPDTGWDWAVEKGLQDREN
jgi:hypothetical protein